MRRRLTLEAFMAVRAKAPQVYPWLAKAMDLALVTGCDRQTIAKLERRKHIVGDYLEFQRGKTQVRIAIPLDIELRCTGLRLRDVVKNTTNIASRFLIHHTISYPGTPAGSPVFVNTMTEAFRLAYDLTDLPKDNAPTFHEIRSLAKRLYMAQGNVDTKALLGQRSDQAGALYADPRGAEALRVPTAPLPLPLRRRHGVTNEISFEIVNASLAYDLGDWAVNAPHSQAQVAEPAMSREPSRAAVASSSVVKGKLFRPTVLAWLHVDRGGGRRGEIDHVNGDPRDNRLDNLRDVTSSVNQQNRRGPQSNNTSGFRGVTRTGTAARQWRAQIKVPGGKVTALGCYETPEEASDVYEAASTQSTRAPSANKREVTLK